MSDMTSPQRRAAAEADKLAAEIVELVLRADDAGHAKRRTRLCGEVQAIYAAVSRRLAPFFAAPSAEVAEVAAIDVAVLRTLALGPCECDRPPEPPCDRCVAVHEMAGLLARAATATPAREVEQK